MPLGLRAGLGEACGYKVSTAAIHVFLMNMEKLLEIILCDFLMLALASALPTRSGVIRHHHAACVDTVPA